MNIKREKLLIIMISLLVFVPMYYPARVTAQASSINTPLLRRIPDNGIQPQIAVDSKGIVHLVYYKGDSQAGDIYYVKLGTSGQALTAPIKVNSQPGSAVATGWVRGAQIAIGKGDRVHVIWNGSGTAEPRVNGSRPMLYTRLAAKGNFFEPQRNLIQWAGGIDGGGALTADNQGRVYVFWHAPLNGEGDAGRSIFISRSINEGKDFLREEKVKTASNGACSCCSMKANIDTKGNIYLLYRAAGKNINRDTMLLVSTDHGKSFSSEIMARWQLEACPLTTFSITQTSSSGSVVGSWINQDQVYFAQLNSPLNATDNSFSKPIFPTGADAPRKYQSIATNARDEKLLAWVEGTAWGRGGTLVWQLFDKNNHALGEKSRGNSVPAWSFPAAFARPDGQFILIY